MGARAHCVLGAAYAIKGGFQSLLSDAYSSPQGYSFTPGFSTLGKIFSRRNFEIFFLFFFQKTRFDISCKLETICIKCQILFSEKNEKKYNQPVIC